MGRGGGGQHKYKDPKYVSPGLEDGGGGQL